MKRILLFALSTVFLLSGVPVRAEEPDHLQFVRGLRERRMSDLALDYLKRLDKKKLPAETVAILPLETARTLAAYGSEVSDLGQRKTLFNQARNEFQAFLASKPAPRLAADTSLEQARVAGLEGKAQFLRALRQETVEARRAEARAARPILTEARNLYKGAAGGIIALLAKSDLQAADKKALLQAKNQAEFEEGLMVLNLAQTFDENEEAQARGDTVTEARKILEKVAAGNDKEPLVWQARAWIGRCYIEIQDPTKALDAIVKVINEGGAHLEPGKRLARYFFILILDKDSRIKDPVDRKLTEAEAWLKRYPDEINTPEGLGVRFEYAQALVTQAVKKSKAQASKAYEEAEQLFEAVERSDSELAQKAHEEKLQVMVARLGKFSRDDLGRYRSFGDCFIQAQAEIGRMNREEKETANKPPAGSNKDGPAKTKKEHFENIVLLLSRALDLADDKTDVKDLMDAKYLLTYAYLATNDPYRAVVMGEELARSAPRSGRAASSAGYALQAYAQILGEEERNEAAPDQLKCDRAKQRALADYILQSWPADIAADFARHQLGDDALREKDYPRAVALLSQIGPAYGLYTLSQFQLANAALQAQKEGMKPSAGQPSFQEQATLALQKIPDVSANADRVTIQYFMYGKMQLAKLLWVAKQYQGMEKVIEQLKKKLAEVPLDEETKKDLQPAIEALPWYAKYGQAEIAFQAGKYADIHKLMEPIAKSLKENKPIDFKDPVLLRFLLGLDLRAYVQEGNSGKAQETLDILLRSASDFEGGATGVLVELVKQLQEHIEALKKKGNKEELAKTVDSFANFLSALRQQPNLSPPLIRFLAFSYSGLEMHKEAAQMLAKYPKPAPSKNPDKEKSDKENRDNENFYNGLRVLLAREWRLAGRLLPPESRDREFNFTQADKVLKELLSSPWGRRNLELRKEQVALYEDMEKYPAAFTVSKKTVEELQPVIKSNARIKEQYYDWYYHLNYSLFKTAQRMKDQANKERSIRRVAQNIADLEKIDPFPGGETLRKKYRELLDKEPMLKEKYDGLKENGKTTGP